MKPFHLTATKVLAISLMLPLGACAGTAQERQPVQAVSSTEATPAPAEERVVEAEIAWEGTVTAVDSEARLLTVRDAEGEQRTLSIDEQVQRLEQMQAGDRVQVYYRRSLVFDMQPGGSAEPGAYIWQDEQRPDPDRPGIVDREVVVVLSPLVAVDTAANTLSVRAPNGSVHVLDVEQPRHRAALADLEVGDLLRIQFRKLLAVRVLPEE